MRGAGERSLVKSFVYIEKLAEPCGENERK